MSEFEYVNCDGCDTGLVKAERIVGSVLICHCERCFQQLQAELDKANDENKRLRDAMQKIIALYNRDKERGCFASSQDFQCGIRKGKKEAAVIAEQALNPAKDKESDPQQYKPANKCITPGCGNLIDSNHCAKCREDWAS